MNRLNFLRVSVLGAVVALLGFDREKAARRWLEVNGFVAEADALCGKTHLVIYNPAIGACGGCSRFVPNMDYPYASDYLELMAKWNWEIEQRFVMVEVTGEEWDDLRFTEREIKPPVIHRFTPPWWA